MPGLVITNLAWFMQVQLNPDFSVNGEFPNPAEKCCWNYTKDEFNPDSLMPVCFSCAHLWFCHAGSERTNSSHQQKHFMKSSWKFLPVPNTLQVWVYSVNTQTSPAFVLNASCMGTIQLQLLVIPLDFA